MVSALTISSILLPGMLLLAAFSASATPGLPWHQASWEATAAA